MVMPVNLHSDGGKDWLEIVVKAYPIPISYKGEYHYRSGSTKQEFVASILNVPGIWRIESAFSSFFLFAFFF